MKKYLILFTSFFLLSCEKTIVASTGESMWVVLNHVKADKRQQFEEFVYQILLPALEEDAKNNLSSRNIIAQTRMLEPTRINDDSSYTYIWLMDPLVKDANYGYNNILSKVYSPEETEKYISLLSESMFSSQVSYRVNQGSW